MEIDVSKCEYYNDYNKTCNNCGGDDKPYCNAKELKCSYYIRNLENQLQQLKEHCKQVGETIKILYQEKCVLTKENNELKKYIDRAGIVGFIKISKCIDEIERFAKVFYCANCTDLGLCPECYEHFRNEILQKIKEVKGNEQ